MSGQPVRQRLFDIQCFYQLLVMLEKKIGGKRTLGVCNGRLGWPQRGVYFIFEPGEERTTSGTGPRVVRVGTHGLKTGGTQTFWNRLKCHQGNVKTGGGNHRGSIFRLHIGSALINQGGWPDEITRTWEGDRDGNHEIRHREEPLEKAVSKYIRNMPFLWLEVDDEPGPDCLRGYIERNTIALLSNHNQPNAPIDAPSVKWLGNWSQRDVIRSSGLWNVNHVTEDYDPQFLNALEMLVERM